MMQNFNRRQRAVYDAKCWQLTVSFLTAMTSHAQRTLLRPPFQRYLHTRIRNRPSLPQLPPRTNLFFIPHTLTHTRLSSALSSVQTFVFHIHLIIMDH